MNTYEKCCSIRQMIVHCTAEVMNYENWGKDYSYGRIMELSENIKTKDINPSDLSISEMKELGFGRFSNDSELMLIPLWLMKFIDPEIDVECITGMICKMKDADNDHRFGCIAYGVYPKK